MKRALFPIGLAATLAITFAQESQPAPAGSAAIHPAPPPSAVSSTGAAAALTPEEAAKKKAKEQLELFQSDSSITNSLGVVLVHMKGGYRVAQIETTQTQFEALLGRNPSKHRGPQRPVDKVSPTDAREFCAKLTEQEQTSGSLPKSFAYGLPSESQFDEYVQDTGLDTACVSFIGDRLSSIDVGSLPANPVGLYDVRGNVWEWCDNNVARGGSYQSHEDYLNPAFRFAGTPDSSVEDIGFRVVLRETGPAAP